MKIAICTGGGDCPGLNAAIRAVVKHAKLNYGFEVIGVYDSFNGLMDRPIQAKSLDFEDVTEILWRGGTVLGTYNKGSTYTGHGAEKRLQLTAEGMKLLGAEVLIVVGGEGTQSMAQQLSEIGVPVIGIPKTIDNDLPGTDQTIGFSSCVDLVADSVMRLHSTAESHDRVMVLEVMGRDSGYIALHGGLAGGANVILIPEVPFDFDKIYKKIMYRKSLGRNFSLVVVSEGASEKGGEAIYSENSSGSKNLGGIGQRVARKLNEMSGMETRVTVLGHLQRGGAPNAADKLLATRFGIHAVELAAKKAFNRLVVLKNGAINDISYKEVPAHARRKLSLDDDVLRAAESIGISIGR